MVPRGPHLVHQCQHLPQPTLPPVRWASLHFLWTLASTNNLGVTCSPPEAHSLCWHSYFAFLWQDRRRSPPAPPENAKSRVQNYPAHAAPVFLMVMSQRDSRREAHSARWLAAGQDQAAGLGCREDPHSGPGFVAAAIFPPRPGHDWMMRGASRSSVRSRRLSGVERG